MKRIFFITLILIGFILLVGCSSLNIELSANNSTNSGNQLTIEPFKGKLIAENIVDLNVKTSKPASCIISEFYEGKYNDQRTHEVEETKKVQLFYEAERKPSKIRYDVECTAGNLKGKKSLEISLKYR